MFRNMYLKFQKGKDLPQLNIGEGVQVQLKPDTDKRWQPATVSRQLTERAYEIDTGGTKYVRDRVNLKDRATSIQDLEKEENLIHKEMRTSCVPKEQNQMNKEKPASCVLTPKRSLHVDPSDEISSVLTPKKSLNMNESDRPKRNIKPFRFKDFVYQ
uniref:Uncharacterized protein n=1 Tax=Photinus pyralis TaxID=7054 RepID=A0A1Y1K6V5_PHOPY